MTALDGASRLGPTDVGDEDVLDIRDSTGLEDRVGPEKDEDFSQSPWNAWTSIYREWSWNEGHQDGPFYRRLSELDRRLVVEVGCGDGRLIHDVEPHIAIDNAGSMIDEARKNVSIPVDLRLGSAEWYTLSEPASFTFIAFNTFVILGSEKAQRRTLQNVFANTAPGGYLAFDCLLTTPAEMRSRDGWLRLRHRADDWAVYTCTMSRSDNFMEMHAVVDELDERGIVQTRRYLPPTGFHLQPVDRIREMAEDAGWTVRDVWSDFDQRPIDQDSHWQIWVLQKPPA